MSTIKTTSEQLSNVPACAAAGKIFERLDRDIRNRRGLKHEWCAIDDDVMNDEIRPKWEGIIAEEIAIEVSRQSKSAQADPVNDQTHAPATKNL